MIFQRVLKGLPAQTATQRGLTDSEAQKMVDGLGLLSSWWMNAPRRHISPVDVPGKLTGQALQDHLSNYDAVADTTAFISTTAGTVQYGATGRSNAPFPPEYTALSFATRQFSQTGYLVHAYVYVLGRRSLALQEFAEEVRDVNLYTNWYEWHHEGEVVAKVHIPAQRIEKIERYDHGGLEAALDAGQVPSPQETFTSSREIYREPMAYVNLRGFPDFGT